MNKLEVPLFEIEWDEKDVKAISDVIKSGRNWAIGHQNVEFEKKITEFFGVKYCTLFNSGTSALHAILLAYGISAGDEVIVPSFSFISTANSVLLVGAKPVFAEVEPQTLGLSPKDVQERITKKTKAIIPVHYAGCPSKTVELKDVAEENNLLLIEDAAESFGADIKGEKVGTFGDSAMLSFCQNKIITTGEGGAIITDSKSIADKLCSIRSHGRCEKENYFTSAHGFEYSALGYNFRLSNILAALGYAQLKKVTKLINLRREKAAYYHSKLANNEIIETFKPPKEYNSVYQLFSIFVKKEYRDMLISFLKEKKITSKIYFDPIHLSVYYRKLFGYKEGDLYTTEDISKEILSLPIYPTLSLEQIDYIIEKIDEFINLNVD